MRSSFAQSSENGITGSYVDKKTSTTTSTMGSTKPYSVQSNTNNANGPVPSKSDELDFNNVSAWIGSAYQDNNKTRLIVGINGGNLNTIAKLGAVAARHQGKIVNQISMGGNISALVVELQLASVTTFADDVHRAGLASYIEPNMKVQAQFVPNDPYWSKQWGPQKIQADWAWNTTEGSSSVLVAVVDTGIDYNHPDLAANYLPLGYNWVSNNADPLDDFGHGTHCAGIIAAVLNNSIGIAGIAQVHIMAEKVLDSWGYGYWDWVANGIIHAADEGANIISMSLGGYGDSELVHDAVKYAYNAGVLLVAAAGNDATNMKSYPAAYDEVVAVAATDQYDNTAWFSNYGDWIELAAPGVDVYSTMPTYYVTLNGWGYSMNYDSLSGTSMACPHVAGVAALIWSRYPSKTRDWVRLWLRYTADDLGAPGFDDNYGYGRVNARKAVEQALPSHDLIAYEWKTPPYVLPRATGMINGTILNFGGSDEANVTVQFLANDTPVGSTVLGLIPSGTSVTISLEWNPTVEGLYNVTLYVVPVPNEANVENNILTKYLEVGTPVKAVVLRSYGNVLGQSIMNWQALNDGWYIFGSSMIYIDYTTLNKENITYEDINATQADVLIISCACSPYMGWQFTDSEIEAIGRYVHEGHGLIATAGTFYYQVPNNNKLAPLFGMNDSLTWYATYTDLLHLVNATHPIFTNVPNPLILPREGTAIPADGRWDSDELVYGKYLALGHYQESAIVCFRGLVYISAWPEVIPPYYHHHLQLLYNAIVWSRYQKPAHELVVSLETPKYLQPGESALLNATVYNGGSNIETNVELNILIDNAAVNSTTIQMLPVDGSCQIQYLWTPTVSKVYNITAYSPPLYGEDITSNNYDSVLLYVRHTRFILFDISHNRDGDSLSGNFLSLGELLDANGFIVDEVATGPINSALLAKYDILVLMDPEVDFSPSELADIQSWIAAGGGLVAVPDGGYPPTTNTLLAPYGVQLTGWAGGYGITTDIANDTITQGVSQIYVNYVREISVTPPSTCLAWVTDSGKRIGFLSATEGGEVVVISDENTMDNNGLGMADNTQLMLNIFNWAGIKPDHDLAVSLEAPTFLQSGNSAQLSATVRNHGLNNESNVQLKLLINGIIVDSETIPQMLSNDVYTLNFSWTPVEGDYNVTAYAPPVPMEELLENNVVTKSVIVRSIKYVLVDQTHGTNSITSYIKWMTSLTERGYVIDTLNTGPVTPTVLEKYDIFVIPQAQYSYTPDELSAIQNYVFNGGGLLVMGNNFPTVFTDLTSFAGITWTYGGIAGFTQDIKPHPVTAGVASVYFSSPMAIMYVSGPAEDLVRDPGHNVMLAVSEQPSGKVMGFADGYSLWDYAITQADNLRLADNMMDWLAVPIPSQHDLKVGLTAPSSLELTNSTLLTATVRNNGLNDETNVELFLLINDTVVDNATVPSLLAGESHVLTHEWTPSEPGMYNITAYAPPVAEETNVANNNETQWTYVFVDHYVRSYIPHEWTGGGKAMGWHSDDSSWNYSLPFDFPFYGVSYSTIFVSSNGLITFSPDASAVHSVSALAGKLAMAVAWYDWATFDPYDVYVWEDGTYVGIRWQVEAIGSGAVGNFEAILSSEGVIQFDYEHFDRPLSATVGISNGAGHMLSEDVIIFGQDNTVVFLPYPGNRDVAVLSLNPSANQVPAGDPVNMTVVVENKGNFTENFEVTAYAFKNSTNTASLSRSTRIYLDPPEYKFTTDSISVGYTFNVTAKVENVANLATFQLGMYYNGSILKATRWFVPSWDPEYVFYNETEIVEGDLGSGYAIVGAARMSGESSFNGSGKLCIIEFEVMAVPQNGDTYSSILNINNSDTFLLSGIVEIPAIKENGYYEVQQLLPPSMQGKYTVGTQFVMSLAPGETRTLYFTWDTTGVSPGDYVLHAEASQVPCENNTDDNIYYDGIVTVEPGVTSIHDVAVTNVTGLSSFAYQGWTVKMNVTAANLGNATENFTVTLYYDTTVIATQPVQNLNPNATTTLSFNWNTTYIPCCHNYTIKAVASTVPSETNTANNELVAGQVNIKLMGDINGDGVVNMKDVSLAVLAFHTSPGLRTWNPYADLNNDNLVDMRDINIAIINFNRHG
jgi:thermitase